MVMTKATLMNTSGSAVFPGPAGVRIGTVQSARAVRYPTVRRARGNGTSVTRGARTDARLLGRPRSVERVRRPDDPWAGARWPDVGSGPGPVGWRWSRAMVTCVMRPTPPTARGVAWRSRHGRYARQSRPARSAWLGATDREHDGWPRARRPRTRRRALGTSPAPS